MNKITERNRTIRLWEKSTKGYYRKIGQNKTIGGGTGSGVPNPDTPVGYPSAHKAVL